MSDSTSGFLKAEAVWLSGKSHTMNVQAGFEMEFKSAAKKKYVLHITGSTLYRISVNGIYVHYGPARAPHGYLRIDKIPINNYITDKSNNIFIEVAGYNIGTYYTLDIPSFVQAEVIEDDSVICYSSIDSGVRGFEMCERIRKTVRYSFQRNFSEVYHLENNKQVRKYEKLEIIHLNRKYLEREVPIPEYLISPYDRIINEGKVIHKEKSRDNYIKTRFIDGISDEIQGYKYAEIEEHPFETVQECEFVEERARHDYSDKVVLKKNRYILFDMGCNNTGFILANIKAEEDSEVYFTFDEKLIDRKVDVKNWSSVNVIKYSLKASNNLYNIESFESYGFKYIQFFILKGKISLEFRGIREYSYPKIDNTEFCCADNVINDIVKAAVETYRQNTLDVFMDCPTRERAGWLCDSFFTAQSEQFFSGRPLVEKVMLENFLLADEFPFIPKGMIPMCYPSEHRNGNFIPQWAMWYVIELEQYLGRDTHSDKFKFRDLCYGLVEFFKHYINSDGLLESLPGWNFIEWSNANKFMQEVHYPTNMLYSKMLGIIGMLYDDDKLVTQSKAIKKEILEQSFNGTCFIDNAVRKADGTLEITDNMSEVCQYFALFFGVADLESKRFGELKHLVLNVFGPNRKKLGIMPEIVYANAFIGNYLRMEILMQHRYYVRIVNEAKEYFHNMAITTGTLWENDNIMTGSLNHGFASFIGAALVKSILGIRKIDIKKRSVELDFSFDKIEASGKIGTIFGDIEITREMKDSRLVTNYIVPDGLKVILIQ